MITFALLLVIAFCMTFVMVKLTPKEFQEKQARRLKASLPDIAQGIDRTTEAPGKKAAKKVEKMKANLLARIEDGTWEENVAAVTLDEWKEKALKKGVPRISAGIDEAAEKVEKFAEKLLPHVEAGQKIIDAMPDLTLEDSIARQAAMTRHMAKLHYKKK